MAEVSLLVGRVEEAARLVERALTMSREHRQRGDEAAALRLAGEVASHREPPDVEVAETRYRDGLTRAEELEMRPLVAHCHLGLGRLYRRISKRDPALEHHTAAVTMYREMGMTYWLEEANRSDR